MTIDDLRAKAEAAKAWRPDLPTCDPSWSARNNAVALACGLCELCLGAERAVEDIAAEIDEAVENWEAREDGGSFASDMGAVEDACAAIGCADRAARIASYFCSEPNDVSRFRDAVKEMKK